MTNTITATQVLEMLAKSTLLGIHYGVYEYEETNEYAIQFEVDWYADEFGAYSYEKVIISNDNVSDGYGGWDVLSFISMLDEKLKEKEQEKIKEQKRKELLAKLTSEEKELLGLDSP